MFDGNSFARAVILGPEMSRDKKNLAYRVYHAGEMSNEQAARRKKKSAPKTDAQEKCLKKNSSRRRSARQSLKTAGGTCAAERNLSWTCRL